MVPHLINRELPEPLLALAELAVDLRWSWNHAGDHLWSAVDNQLWQQTQNPYTILRAVSDQRLQQLAKDKAFLALLHKTIEQQNVYKKRQSWYSSHYADKKLNTIAFFSMEYGIGKALPFYAGGLGILAGDFLKAASDLGIPLVAVGLLFHQGYFRQSLTEEGAQQELYPSCDTQNLPICRLLDDHGRQCHVMIELPGRKLTLNLWRAVIGHINLYLLDSDHPSNTPYDCAITSQLYPASKQARFLQQFVLGVAGWRALRELGINIDICHLNESHCAFVVLERIRDYMQRHNVGFDEALLVTSAGNIFTTHTPVPAAFDCYDEDIIDNYLTHYARLMSVCNKRLVRLGQPLNHNGERIFAPVYLALRSCLSVNAVSQSHRDVMRHIFQAMYPRWPNREVPVRYITNGVHVPSWDSPWADQLWTQAAGKERWLGDLSGLMKVIDALSDDVIWGFKCHEREDLVSYVRRRLHRDMAQHASQQTAVALTRDVLDPNVLTLGLARRFTQYKRPNLLLSDQQRLINILSNPHTPVQIIVSGKAHPEDHEGKQLIKQWVEFSQQSSVNHRVVFLVDYDIDLAQELVQGVDVWINTPQCMMEACGTSGMKVLVNGGLNLSALDGWWAEAYQPLFGWAIGDQTFHSQAQQDVFDASQIYDILEKKIVPEFYRRDERGLPKRWIARMRTSMATLTPQYSSNRMVREYMESIYLSAAQKYRGRVDNNAGGVTMISNWLALIREHWHKVHWLERHITTSDSGFDMTVHVYLGEIPTDAVKVQLYADGDVKPSASEAACCECIEFVKSCAMKYVLGAYIYQIHVKTLRPAVDYTPRIIAWHEHAVIPNECASILWWDD